LFRHGAFFLQLALDHGRLPDNLIAEAASFVRRGSRLLGQTQRLRGKLAQALSRGTATFGGATPALRCITFRFGRTSP